MKQIAPVALLCLRAADAQLINVPTPERHERLMVFWQAVIR